MSVLAISPHLPPLPPSLSLFPPQQAFNATAVIRHMRRLQLGSSLNSSFGSSMSFDQQGPNSMLAKSMSVDCATLSRKDGD